MGTETRLSGGAPELSDFLLCPLPCEDTNASKTGLSNITEQGTGAGSVLRGLSRHCRLWVSCLTRAPTRQWAQWRGQLRISGVGDLCHFLMTSGNLKIISFLPNLSLNIKGQRPSRAQKGPGLPSDLAQSPGWWEAETRKPLFTPHFQGQNLNGQ